MSPPVKHEYDFLLAEMRKMHNENREDHAKIWEEVTEQGKKLAGIEVKSGVWGLVAGCIPVAVLGAWVYIKQLVNGGEA
jgi:hypothetical protein